jgi:coenzyme F420-0:L-glutamate ligase / coenzyme F420-1:gamma-L-glutamate ligase
MTGGVEINALAGIPEVREGDPVGELIAGAAVSGGLTPAEEDAVVISQKIVSKAEGRLRSLADVSPGARARDLADQLDKDARLVELILAESRRIVRAERGVLIAETHGGLVCANAGIDTSNVPGEGTVSLLPADPDASARRIRAEIAASVGGRPGVVIADSFGRPWRLGQAEVAIGCAGITPLDDWRGRRDGRGQELQATVVAVADELAAAADLVRDKASLTPAAIVSGVGRWVTAEDGPGAATIRRAEADDLFR